MLSSKKKLTSGSVKNKTNKSRQAYVKETRNKHEKKEILGDQFASTVLYIHTNQSCKKRFPVRNYVMKFEQKRKIHSKSAAAIYLIRFLYFILETDS